MNQQCGEAYLFTGSDLLRARLDALEDAANLCHGLGESWANRNSSDPGGMSAACHGCAAAIRALGNENRPPPAARPEGAS